MKTANAGVKRGVRWRLANCRVDGTQDTQNDQQSHDIGVVAGEIAEAARLVDFVTESRHYKPGNPEFRNTDARSENSLEMFI